MPFLFIAMKTHLLSFLLLLLLVPSAQSQTYQPTEENLKSRQEFRDNRFGIFLHWGIYSMLATGEWTMTNKNLNYKEYAKLAGGFLSCQIRCCQMGVSH